LLNTNIIISKRLALINSVASLGAMLLNGAVAIWLQQYLIRRIGPEEYSLIAVLSAVMIFLPLLTTVLTSGIGRYVVESYAKGDELRITQIISTMFPILLAAAVFVSIIGYFSVRYVDLLVKIEPRQIRDARIMLAVMMFSFVVRLLLAPFVVGLYVQQKFVLENCINFGAVLFRIILLFLLLFYVSTSVVWVIVASTSGDLIGLLLIIIVSRKQVPSLRFYMKEFRWHLVRTLVSFGGWNVIGQLGSAIRSAADPLILNRFATPVDVTSFYLGSLADRTIRQLIAASTNPILPQLTAMHATDRRDGLASAFLRLGRFSIWTIMLMIGPLLIFRQEIFQLYLQEKFLTYGSATIVMFLLLSYLPISYSLSGLDYIVLAIAKIRTYMVITSSSQIINLILTIYFVAFLHMGAVGSALATFLVGTTVTLFAYFPLSLKLTGVTKTNFVKETIFPGLMPGIVGIVVWIILRTFVQPSNWMELGICLLLGMFVYLSVLFIWCLQPTDRNDLQKILSIIKLKLRQR
jgi:O-antigen/teichoic acid export membrane protein